jgi:energy-coupling factor transporter ATP-binding protein EcfA2
MTRQEAKEKFRAIVDFSGVGEFIELPMKTYSSGMGSRLRFAIAASKSHDVLLVDEALATGDAEFRVKSHARISELRREAGTVFLVAHNLEEIEQTCNRVIWLEKGKIVAQGEDVIGIIDRYIDASGGKPVERDPVTRERASSRVHAKTVKPPEPPCHPLRRCLLPVTQRLRGLPFRQLALDAVADAAEPISPAAGSAAGSARRSRSRMIVPPPGRSPATTSPSWARASWRTM